MGMGRKNRLQESLWIATPELPRTKGHVFYERVNQILEENRFDRFAEQACQKFYAPVMGRPGVALGVYFRMLLVGHFEGLDSEQRCCMDRGGDGIHPFPSGSVRRCVRTQAVRVRSLCSGLSDRPGSP